MKIKDVNYALNIFEKSAKIQTNATEIGDYKTGNKSYHKIVNSIKYLIVNNELDKLKPYLLSETIGEQLWAAYFLLKTDEENSIKVLEIISLNKGMVGFTAETTLNEWRKGNVNYDELG